jgi:hypothetical protein
LLPRNCGDPQHPALFEARIAVDGELCLRLKDGFVKAFRTRGENGWVSSGKWGKRADFGLKMRLFGGFVFTS